VPRREDHNEFLQRRAFNDLNATQLESAIARTRLPLESDAQSSRARAVAAYWSAQYEDEDEVLLSFPMINRLAEWLLRENPVIRKALQHTFPVVFLDEFQDTTHAQFELLHIAFDGSETVFTAVGDAKQRIMVWAGAMSNAFERFEEDFGARRIALVSNWRSHRDLVLIQHVIAATIDPDAECPEARAEREIDGDVAAIWEFDTNEEEAARLARWIDEEVRARIVKPHDVAILVRMYANDVETSLSPKFSRRGLRLRNAARNVGDIAIQDLLGEDLTALCVPLLRLAARDRSPEYWNQALQNLQYLEAIDPIDERAQERIQRRLAKFVRELRRDMRAAEPSAETAAIFAGKVLEFLGKAVVRQTFPGYQRTQDFDRVWNGFVLLLQECAESADTWSITLDEFEGLGQVALMTIHKSKGLEFHTMIFYGLDNQTW
jgi:superfamily I DNA/RNA helicase